MRDGRLHRRHLAATTLGRSDTHAQRAPVDYRPCCRRLADRPNGDREPATRPPGDQPPGTTADRPSPTRLQRLDGVEQCLEVLVPAVDDGPAPHVELEDPDLVQAW